MQKMYQALAVTVLATVLSACNTAKSSQSGIEVSSASGSTASGVCREQFVTGQVHPLLPKEMLPVFSGTGVEVKHGQCTPQPSGGYIVDTVLNLSSDRYDEVVKYYRDVLPKIHGDRFQEMEVAKGEHWIGQGGDALHKGEIVYIAAISKIKSDIVEIRLQANYPAK